MPKSPTRPTQYPSPQWARELQRGKPRHSCRGGRPLLQMADECQHREHRLHEHTILPLAPLTQFEIRGIALGRMEAGITQDNHLLLKWPNQPLKGLVCDLGGITRPPHD